MPQLAQRVASAFGFPVVDDDDDDDLNDDLDNVANGMNIESATITSDWIFSLEGGQTIGLLAVACVTHLLGGDEGVQARDNLPRLHRVPFWNKRRTIPIPLPEGGVRTGVLWADSSVGTALRGYGAAAGPGYARWLRENMDALIEDLTDREWVGYYTYGAEARSRVDEPLRGIRFTAEADPDDGDGVLIRAHGCEDAVDKFNLDGTVSRRSGWVVLRKSYASGLLWVNQGWLTPLGIVGYWGDQPGRGYGFVWMYKRSWTTLDAREDVGHS
ncbi:hypothetical protein B0T14DRAFT_513493 [Immersiella caudata]|uniref:Uncharacterized protein n=1 Tax=Immersiella caudata TaxID=314043 RepID=A0AA39X632_9PEZI|nr:hypothetical protein B0T14DRAFT_513493 [Immersiella caudata]